MRVELDTPQTHCFNLIFQPEHCEQSKIIIK